MDRGDIVKRFADYVDHFKAYCTSDADDHEMLKAVLSLLKGQEAKYPVCEKCGKKLDHIITSVFNYDGSDSECSFPIDYYEDGGCIQFSTTQNWTGYELSDAEQKDSIRCPFCGEFPFDANEEIELYEPEKVIVMIWERREQDGQTV